MEEGFEGSHDVQDNRGGIESVRSNKIRSCSALWPSNYTRSGHWINPESPSDRGEDTTSPNRIGEPLSSPSQEYTQHFLCWNCRCCGRVVPEMWWLSWWNGSVVCSGLQQTQTGNHQLSRPSSNNLRCCLCHFLGLVVGHKEGKKWGGKGCSTKQLVQTITWCWIRIHANLKYYKVWGFLGEDYAPKIKSIQCQVKDKEKLPAWLQPEVDLSCIRT